VIVVNLTIFSGRISDGMQCLKYLSTTMSVGRHDHQAKRRIVMLEMLWARLNSRLQYSFL